MVDEKFYTVKEVAFTLGVSPSHVYQLITLGSIRAHNVAAKGSRKAIWRLRGREVNAFLKQTG